jgi:hypothetical protein
MVKFEPKFMRELHKIREEISKECRGKTSAEVINTIRKTTSKTRRKK